MPRKVTMFSNTTASDYVQPRGNQIPYPLERDAVLSVPIGMVKAARHASQQDCSPPLISELEREVGQLGRAVTELHARIDFLFDRLKPVSFPRETPEHAGPDMEKTASAGSPMGKTVRSIRLVADGAAARIQILLEQLAV